MRLTAFSDYALRVLMYGAATEGRLVTVEETARAFNVSRTHLMKVVSFLAHAGYLKSMRGRTGGFMLAMPPEAINLGAVIRRTEPDFVPGQCLTADPACPVSPHCNVPKVMGEAIAAFVATLDQYTLADIALPKDRLAPTDSPAVDPPESRLRPTRT